MTTEPPPKKRGRPAIADDAPSVRLSVRVAPRDFDTLARQAQSARLTLSALLRDRFLSDKN